MLGGGAQVRQSRGWWGWSWIRWSRPGVYGWAGVCWGRAGTHGGKLVCIGCVSPCSVGEREGSVLPATAGWVG